MYQFPVSHNTLAMHYHATHMGAGRAPYIALRGNYTYMYIIVYM